MLNIYIISNNERIGYLIDLVQPFIKSKIRSASDFDRGLKEVFENRPSMVFVQNIIGDVSGDTVARHIKSLLGPDSPLIIFLDEAEAVMEKSSRWCDDRIRIDGPERDFHSAFLEILKKYFPDDLSRGPLDKDGSMVPLETAPEEVPDYGIDEDLEWMPVTERCPEVDTRESVPMKLEMFMADKDDPIRGENQWVTVGDIPESLDEENICIHEKSFSPGQYKQAGKMNKAARGLVCGLVIAVLTGSFIWFVQQGRVSGMNKTVSHPAESSRPSKAEASLHEKKNDFKGLPSFIQTGWLDPQYKAGHPGWDRYVSPDLEFRLYRDKGSIKALQVIGRTTKGIAGGFLYSVLKDFSCTGPSVVENEHQENGFLVRTVKIVGTAELVTYKKRGETKLQAFVLVLS